MDAHKTSVNPSSSNLPKDPALEKDPKLQPKEQDKDNASKSSSSRHNSKSKHHHHKHHHHRHHHHHHHSKRGSPNRSRSRSYSKSKSRSRSRTRNASSKPSELAAGTSAAATGATGASASSHTIPYNKPEAIPIKPPPVSQLDLTGTGSGLKPTTLLQSKYERELYIGNLPPGLTNNQLADLLNHALIRLGAVCEPGDPIVNAWVGADGRYAFVVFRSVEETNKALALKGVSIMGYQIKVSKIKMTARANYHGGIQGGSNFIRPNTSTIGKAAPKTVGEVAANAAGYKMLEKLQVSNLPKNMTKEQTEKLMGIFGKVIKVDIVLDPVTKTPNGQCFVEFSTEAELQKATAGALGMKLAESVLETKKVPISQTSDTLAIGILIKNAAGQLATNPNAVDALIGITPKTMKSVLETHPSRVVKLKNLVNVAELFDSSCYEELLEDINEQCQRYGKIVSIEVPRPAISGPPGPGLGFVYVQYETVDQAMGSVKELNGLMFSGKKVEAVYYPEDSFKKKVLDL